MSTRPPASGETVEVAHEAVAHHWPRLREWLALDQAARLAQAVSTDPFGVNGRDRGVATRARRHHPRRARFARKRRAADQPGGTPGSVTDDTTAIQETEAALGAVEVAHEALIRHWPRLREWLDEDRSGLLLREAISEAAHAWDQSGRDESYLAHRGRRLDEAATLAQHPRFALNAQEQAYLDAALALREREEQEREAQRQRELAAQRERAELAEQRAAEQAAAAQALRRRLVVAVALGAVALLAAIGAFVFFRQADEQRVLAEGARIEAENQAFIARARALAGDAPRQHEVGQDERGALLARQAFLFNQAGGGPAVGAADSALRAALGGEHFSLLLTGFPGTASTVLFSKDGAYLGAKTDDGWIRLWYMRDRAAPTIELDVGYAVDSIALGPDGRTLALGHGDGVVHLRDVQVPSAPPVALPGSDAGVGAVAFAPDGQTVAAGNDDGAVLLWDVRDPTAAPRILGRHDGPVATVAFSENGARLASADDNTVRLWNPREPGAEAIVLADGATSVAFSPDGQTLAAGDPLGVSLWDLRDPTAGPTALAGPGDPVAPVAYRPDGQMLATGSVNGAVRLWDLTHSPPLFKTVTPQETSFASVGSSGWQVVRSGVVSLAFAPDGHTLATGGFEGEEGAVRLWELVRPPSAPAEISNEGVPFSSIAFSPDGRRLASAHDDGKVQLWDPNQEDAEPIILAEGPSSVRSVAFSPDGTRLAAANLDGTIRLWDPAQPGTGPETLLGHTDRVRSVAFAPDGRWLASGSWDETARVWNFGSPDIEATVLVGHDGFVNAVAISPNGTQIASGGGDGTVRLWDPFQPAQAPKVLSAHTDVVWSVAFSPDGRTVASGSLDGTVRLWDLTDAGTSNVLPTAGGGIESVAFSPDGRILAAGGDDGTVLLWDLRQPAAVPTVLRGHQGSVWSVAFSPDGQTLASASLDGDIRLWIVQADVLADAVCNTVWRNLTGEEWSRFVGPDVPYEQTCPNLPPGAGAPPDPAFSAATPNPSGLT